MKRIPEAHLRHTPLLELCHQAVGAALVGCTFPTGCDRAPLVMAAMSRIRNTIRRLVVGGHAPGVWCAREGKPLIITDGVVDLVAHTMRLKKDVKLPEAEQSAGRPGRHDAWTSGQISGPVASRIGPEQVSLFKDPPRPIAMLGVQLSLHRRGGRVHVRNGWAALLEPLRVRKVLDRYFIDQWADDAALLGAIKPTPLPEGNHLGALPAGESLEDGPFLDDDLVGFEADDEG